MAVRDRKDQKSKGNGVGTSLAPSTAGTALAPLPQREPTEITPYVPRRGDGFFANRRTRRMTKSVALGTECLREINEYTKAATTLEQSRQEAERIFAQQDLVPVLIEADRQQALELLANGYAARERAQDLLDEQRRLASHRRQISEVHYETELRQALAGLRQAEMLELRAREIGDRTVDTMLAKGNVERHRALAESEDLLAHIRSYRRPVIDEPAAPIDPTPEAYTRRLVAEDHVALVERRAEQDLAEIEGRRRAEGRDYYTVDEIERRDAIKNASISAVTDVRRGGASDVRRRKAG